ncbi:MAG: helix-turn-helix domain-containing protein [Bacteroidota bacterium]|nr:AraC family transcriptional regulator [Bacteroidota bacterium]
MHELARELKIPVYQLSTFINQEYQKSFVQYINDQRFQQVLEMKEADPDFKSYTIDYIGKKIGFSSRTSFVEFIKKRTGKTPSEFLRGA